MSEVINLLFASGHAAAIGHFPGNPIIPGAVLLSNVVTAICDAEGLPMKSIGVSSAKFLHIVRPGDSVEVSCQRRSDGEIQFDCRLGGTDTTVLKGSLKGGGA